MQPTRFLRPWNFPGRSAGVGCHRLLLSVFVEEGKCMFLWWWWLHESAQLSKLTPLEMQNRKIFVVCKLYPKTYFKKDTECWKFSSFPWLGLCAFVACKLCSTVQEKDTICWDQWMRANEGQSAILSQNGLLITKGKIVIFQCILSDTFLTKYSKLIASDGVSKLPATMP